jgi:hypothetical protein
MLGYVWLVRSGCLQVGSRHSDGRQFGSQLCDGRQFRSRRFDVEPSAVSRKSRNENWREATHKMKAFENTICDFKYDDKFYGQM